MFGIITDSTCDLPQGYCIDNGIMICHLSIYMNDIIYDNTNPVDMNSFYRRLSDGEQASTCQCNPEDIKDCIAETAKRTNEILYIAFSSGMSGSYSNALIVANELMEENPSLHINVVDSLCAAMGEGLLVMEAVRLRDAGKNLEEATNYINKIKSAVVHLFTVDDLFYLYRGGRLSRGCATVGALIQIKPVLHVNNKGCLEALIKCRGRKKALSALVELFGQKMDSAAIKKGIPIAISHGDCIEDAIHVKEMLEERYMLTNISISTLGPVTGAHSGPGTVAVFFIGVER